MTISAYHSGVNMLNQAQSMTTSAARDIQQSSLASPNLAEKTALPASAVSETANITASVDLLQAQTYNQAGVNVIRRSDEMTGSLLNMKV